MNGKQVDEKHTVTMLLAELVVYVLYYSHKLCIYAEGRCVEYKVQ